jgi:hypothetical protein
MADRNAFTSADAAEEQARKRAKMRRTAWYCVKIDAPGYRK